MTATTKIKARTLRIAKVLLGEALHQLERLRDLTVSLDDGEGADGQDWSARREEAELLRGRIQAFLDDPAGAAAHGSHPDTLALSELRDAARQVVDRWEHGDLAGAVRELAALLAEQQDVLDTADQDTPIKTIAVRFSSVSVYEAKAVVPESFVESDDAAVRELILKQRLEREEFLNVKEGGLDIDHVERVG